MHPADIIVGYTINLGHELGWINDFPNVLAYLGRLFEREHCTLVRYGSFAELPE